MMLISVGHGKNSLEIYLALTQLPVKHQIHTTMPMA
jgi:hypothetical protein